MSGKSLLREIYLFYSVGYNKLVSEGCVPVKIKTVPLSYDKVKNLPRPGHFLPKKPNRFLRSVMRIASGFDLKSVDFSYSAERLSLAGDGPWLILMNHSSFIDLEMTTEIFKDRPFCIVCTSDGFVGKAALMRGIGCIPTKKFVRDVTLINDMHYALHELKTSVLMYPEASYSFDGCATPLPRKLGVLLKKLDVPVVMVRTYGAFSRDPLYNCLQKRNVKVSAEVKCLFTRDELRSASVRELDRALDEAFTFDNFRWQKDNGIKIDEPFRADGLERILYHCPCCGAEGHMRGSGVTLTCESCGASCTLDEYGVLRGDFGFEHIPDWYNYERELVRDELERGSYVFECDVDIGVMVDYKAIYMIGGGHLRHDSDGFMLCSDDRSLCYAQSPLACYSLYSDYYWYEIADMVCIGNNDELYYCFPKTKIPVAKARLAAEELYKIKKAERKPCRAAEIAEA